MARKTSEPVASIAGRGLKSPGSLLPAEIKRVCGSALAQVEAERQLAELRERAARAAQTTMSLLTGVDL